MQDYLSAVSPFSVALGATRSIVASATTLTLLATPTGQLFFRSEAIPTGVNCGGAIGQYGLFCIGSELGNLELARWLAIALLLLVVIGITPAATAIPHWYVTWSFMTSSTAVDGGEHLSANLTLILIPLVVLDRRRWHWSRDSRYETRNPWLKCIAYSALALFIAQVMGVYFQASIAKFGVLEWSDGTALWYWMQNPTFSPPEPLGGFIRFLFQFLPITVAATYGTLILQLSLVPAPFYPSRLRRLLLILAVMFHLGIAATMGLWSFSMIMIAADLLLLIRPHEANDLSTALHWRGKPARKEIA
ncbi:MAG TPA: sporulation-delaying protein SdpB family protein [Plantibacter sp.]|uniref:sporulation-delaying protein SdpB family protein n=1 Tax=unclassified Plantibacter TaxID=2624265 RepID=UPI002C43946D|nr:sporulation-delaying protein SdpB family protein [Plantibacter sp.]